MLNHDCESLRLRLSSILCMFQESIFFCQYCIRGEGFSGGVSELVHRGFRSCL